MICQVPRLCHHAARIVAADSVHERLPQGDDSHTLVMATLPDFPKEFDKGPGLLTGYGESRERA